MKIAASDGAYDAYVARFDAISAPVVVVIQEIFGVNADLRATCDELAAIGFIAVSPDLFWRARPGIEFNKLNKQQWRGRRGRRRLWRRHRSASD